LWLPRRNTPTRNTATSRTALYPQFDRQAANPYSSLHTQPTIAVVSVTVQWGRRLGQRTTQLLLLKSLVTYKSIFHIKCISSLPSDVPEIIKKMQKKGSKD
jgi:hypothetical protein